jgi:ubiquinone/menaquinone biosynthesis C-methylase UbiE
MIRRLFFEFLYLIKRARWDSGISPPELIDYLEHAEPGRALDLGCGTGTNVITMAEYGWEAVGIDFSSGAINRARQKSKQRAVDVHFIRGDVLQLKGVDGKFDLILDLGCFHTLSPQAQRQYIINLKRFLRTGGTYLLYAHLERIGVANPFLSSKEEITQIFEGCCECVDIQTGEDSASHHRSAWCTLKRVT